MMVSNCHSGNRGNGQITHLYIYINGGFLKWGGTPEPFIFIDGFSMTETIHFGVPPWLWKPPAMFEDTPQRANSMDNVTFFVVF